MNVKVHYRGLDIYPDKHISDLHAVRRSWWERLFTRPWRPFVRTKIEKAFRVYKYDDVYLCSYECYAAIVKELELKK